MQKSHVILFVENELSNFDFSIAILSNSALILLIFFAQLFVKYFVGISQTPITKRYMATYYANQRFVSQAPKIHL